MYLILGTYTNQSIDHGVYLTEFNTLTKSFKIRSSYGVSNASFVAVNKDFIYAVSENKDPEACFLTALHVEKKNKEITMVNKVCLQRSGPCYVSINKDATKAVVANYLSGSITVVSIDANGALNQVIQQIDFKGSSVHPIRQKQSHLHCAIYSPCQKYVLACDLGADAIYCFTVDDKQLNYLTLQSTTKVALGSGPRHLCFSQDAKMVYVINELSDTIMTFKFEMGKELELIQEIPCDKDKQQASADIHIHPNGKFLLASVRGQKNWLLSYQVDSLKGTLKQIGEQSTLKGPRNFLISPLGEFVFVGNQLSDSLQVFTFNNQSGGLTLVSEFFQVSSIACVEFFK
ncbi:lactonase family protein [Myroides sp. LJL119]